MVACFISLFVSSCAEENSSNMSPEAGTEFQALKGVCVRYVDREAQPGGDGVSWETAFNTVQDGIDAPGVIAGIDNTCEVWVKDIAIINDENGTFKDSIIIDKNVDIYEGFLGTESTRNRSHNRITGSSSMESQDIDARHIDSHLSETVKRLGRVDSELTPLSGLPPYWDFNPYQAVVYYNSGFVGIGTSSPESHLEVTSLSANSTVSISNMVPNSNARLELCANNNCSEAM